MSVRGAAAALLAAGLAAGGNAVLERRRGSDRLHRWRRTNHSDAEVLLTEGPVAVGSALVAVAAAEPGDCRGAALGCALLGAGAVGSYDDHWGTTQAKGFGGHLRALRAGQVTSGLVKVVGVGLSALAASLLVERGRDSTDRGTVGWLVDVAVDSALVAGTANLVNLLDLRPGRAAKVLLVGGLLTVRSGGGAVAGAAAGSLPVDLSGRAMLGDAGANGLGAGLGVALLSAPRWLRLGLLAGVAGLNAASERISFTAVIADHPVLSRIDAWGRPETDPPPTRSTRDADR